MNLVVMRDEVIAKFGKDSFEAGYIQYSFSHHETPWFVDNYNRMMAPNYTRTACKTISKKN